MDRLRTAIIWGAVFLLSSSGRAGELKTVLLLGQKPDGHPGGTHEYMAGQRLLAKCLAEVKEIECRIVQADDPWEDGPTMLKRADGVVLFVSEGARWIEANAKRQAAFQELAARGAGLVVLHWGMGTREPGPIEGFMKIFGGCHGGPDRKFTVLADADVQIPDKEHPIARGMAPFHVQDEFYYRLKFVQSVAAPRPVLQVPIDGNMETVAWSWERPAGGRSFGFSGLHFHANWRREEYRRLIAHSVLWTLRLPIPDRGLTVNVTEADLTLPSGQ
jgi:type 1 glutamine amidotransferase